MQTTPAAAPPVSAAKPHLDAKPGEPFVTVALAGRPVSDKPEGRFEWARAVKAALDQIPASEAVVLRLAYLERLSYRQIADQLQVPSRQIAARAARALTRLSRILEQV